MNSLLLSAVSLVLSLVWPRAPRHAAKLLVALIELTVKAVRIAEQTGKTSPGHEKFEAVAKGLRLEAARLDLPGWNKIPLRKRKLLLAGLIEFVLVFWDLSDNGKLDFANEPMATPIRGRLAELRHARFARLRRGEVRDRVRDAEDALAAAEDALAEAVADDEADEDTLRRAILLEE